ncbi:MAG: alpha/beta fold hydrolase [Thermoleophilaceae bacterium]|nr:alpha/beta fold hydrolase [Thermoleophilaceae bacterium]
MTAPPVILIHGFAQLPQSWQSVMQLMSDEFDVIAPIVRGHGPNALAQDPPSYAGVREDLLEVLDVQQLGQVVLWGYSQGARIALDFALHQPQRISALVLESGSAGIDDETARATRHAADGALASWIEHHSPEDFAAHWESQPIFGTQSAEAIAEQREVRASHDPMALASALRDLGQSAFEPVWHRLSELTAPTLLLTGGHDETYTQLAMRMAQLLPHCTQVVIPDVGHSVHLEAPEESVAAVRSFLAAQDPAVAS